MIFESSNMQLNVCKIDTILRNKGVDFVDNTWKVIKVFMLMLPLLVVDGKFPDFINSCFHLKVNICVIDFLRNSCLNF